MPFLKFWRSTEPADSRLLLLDLAYLTVLPPLLLFVKVPMLLFLGFVILLIIFRKRPTRLTLTSVALLGGLAIFFSLYGDFNFAGLSRLKLFVELMVYLLLLAVSLQRLSGTINFYLIISPVLLLALSLFFFKSIAMLFYVIFEIFTLLWLIISHQIEMGLARSLRIAGMLFALSLPWVILLFIFFPRISFKHATYGFHGDAVRRMGHDGTMHLDSAALLVPSQRIVMEVRFSNGAIPPDNRLYFRGSVLYIDKKDHWEALPATIKRRFAPKDILPKGMIEQKGDIISYQVSLYPTFRPWLYELDLPLKVPKDAKINADFELKYNKAIEERLHYEALSALKYRYGKNISKEVLRYALDVNRSANPKTAAAAQKIKNSFPQEKKRLQALLNFFQKANLIYTLHPKALDLNHSTDDFLFVKRAGYCVHFASAFVTMARMANLPARIVTGYKAERSNSVKDYLVVKEKDAHAWTEVYIDKHWLRVDPTSTARQIDQKSAALLNPSNPQTPQGAWERVNIYLMYIKYQVEEWILRYSHLRQMQLIEAIKNHPQFAAKFATLILLIFVLSIGVFAYLRRPRCKEKVLCLLRPLLKKLQKEGYAKQEGESMHRLLSRYLNDNPDSKIVKEIDRLYHLLRYKNVPIDLKILKRKIRSFSKLKHSKSSKSHK